jgi:hypothetical protein
MIVFTIRDRDYDGYTCKKPPRWRDAKRSGRLYDISGVEVELFQVGILAEALDTEYMNICDQLKDHQGPHRDMQGHEF